MHRRPLLFLLIGLLAVAVAVPVAQAVNRAPQPANNSHVAALVALGNGFTYQGRLTDGGGPATGVYDIRFILYDAEAGGSQVGPTIEKADITVTNALFTTELDFDAASFDGNARWMEIAIRPGASVAAYTVLSPRQPITPVPYALYAKNVGPHNHLGQTWNGANQTSLKIQNTTAGGSNGLVVEHNGTDGVGIAGYVFGDTGTTVGVEGLADSPAGVGGHFHTSAATGTGLKASGLGPDSTALEIANGPIKVSGANPTAFIHVTTAENTSGHITIITNPLTDGDPNAILIITQHWSPPGGANVYNDAPVAVYYASGKWRIFNQGPSAPLAPDLPIGAGFNVLVIKK